MSRLLTLVLLLPLSLVLVANAEENEKKITRAELPAAVEKTLTAQTQGATIRGFEQEQENGQTLYEAKLTVNGHKKDILMDASGNIVEVEEQVEMESLPSAVKDGLQAQAGNGKIAKIESITKKGQIVAYEAKVMTDGKKSEVQVGPSGKPLAHEE